MIDRPMGQRALMAAACAQLILSTFCGSASAEDDPARTRLAHVSEAASPAVKNALSESPIVKGTSARTRFLIGLDKGVDFHVMSLGNPNRVVVELPEVQLRLPPEPSVAPVGLVESFRGGAAGPGKTRVVVYVTRPVIVEKSEIETAPDGRGKLLALEIVPVDEVVKASDGKPLKEKPSALGTGGLQPPLPQPALRPDELDKVMYKPTIVIDPGHGGHDTGAVKNGAVEKDVVLAFARALRKKIEDTGRYRVLMTRDSDLFVPLDERRAFAEQHKAALFIAVHADYATTAARGATIYSLRESVANSLKRSAKGEVSKDVLSAKELTDVKKASSEIDLSAVKDILADFAQREVETTRERTNLFSRSVIEYMGSSTNMRDDPDQQAAFRVLKTAQFPSVLIELAYVTNKEDAELLKSESWREKVSESITTAVENYFSHQIARLPM
ncbi:MAG: N-acetylmuramoyl-L-alanine amidase [Hyphomicrobium sp.]|nr:N-acetylmuramoyl-L-alanine amidase [Hyphomicrobium sp.]